MKAVKDEHVKDEHVKDAAQDVAEDVTQDVSEDVAEGVLGAAKDGRMNVFITPPEATNTGPGDPGAAPRGVTSKNG